MSALTERIAPRESPYFGLRYFEEKYGAWFFGRDAERGKIITNLRGARLTLLHAESGVGKSSLLRAGVAWRLRELARENPALSGGAVEIPVVFSAWKDDPIPKLIGAIGEAIEPFLAGRPMPELPLDSLDGAIEAAADAVNGSLLVILDQFEEYFVYSPLEPIPERLADELARCVNRPDLPANFLIAIREDAYAGLGELFKGRIANVYGNYLHIEYLDRDAAKSAIRGPLELYNSQPDVARMEIEPGLIEAVLDQVPAHPIGSNPATDGAGGGVARNGDRPVATPLLQLVMQTVWERERSEGSTLLRLSTLQQLEGAESIVDTHLRQALSELNEHERDIAIDVFGDLVTLSGGKIAVSVPDLAGRTAHSETEVAGVLGKLDQARIVSSVEAPPGLDRLRFRRYEIFHDVLAPAINRAIGARTAERRAQRLRKLVASAVGLLIVALALGGFFIYLWRSAEAERKSAESLADAASAEKMAGSEPQLGASLALRALKLHDTPEAEQALRDVLPAVQVQRTLVAPPPAIGAAVSPDGKLLASGLEDGIVGIWDAHSDRLIGKLGRSGLTSLECVAFSPNGKLIVTTYGDGTARIWDAGTRRQVGDVIPVSPHGTVVWSAAFNPAGTEIVTGGNEGTIKVWNVASHKQLGSFSEPTGYDVYDVAWSPNGKLILSASLGGTANVWDVVHFAKAPRASLTPPHSVAIEGAAFSPDGTQIVTVGGEGNAWTWDVASHHRLHELQSGTSGLNSAAFSPDGKSIVTASRAGTVDVWNASASSKTPRMRLKPSGVTTTMLAVAFSRSGDQVVSAGGDGVVRVWNLATRKQAAALNGLSGSDGVTTAAFSHDGKLVVTGTYGGVARVWDAGTGQTRLVITTPHAETVTSVGFSHDAQFFATADEFGHGYIWDAATGELESELSELGQSMRSIQFSPITDTRVLTASEDGTAEIWNPETRHAVHVLHEPAGHALESAAYSADGAHVVTASVDGTTRVWSATTGGLVGRTIKDPGPNASLASARFSPGGGLIVTADYGGTARVWNWRTGQQVGPTLTEPGGTYMVDAQFGDGDREIVTSSSDGTAIVWSAASGRKLLALAGHSGRIASASFSRDGSRIVTASSDGTTKLWNAYPNGEWGAPLQQPGDGKELITAVFDPAGHHVLTASEDGTARIWDAADQRPVGVPLVEPQGPHKALVSAEFDRSGALMVTASEDGSARVWNASSDRQVGVLGHVGDPALTGAVFSPDGRLIMTANSKGIAQVWNAHTHQPAEKPIVADKWASLSWAAFSPDGKQIVTSDFSGNAQIWDRENGGHQGFVISEPGAARLNSAWFSPDGKFVLTSSEDGTARVWSASTNTSTSTNVAVVTEPGRAPIYDAVFGPHGWLLTSSADGYARIWEWKTDRHVLSTPRLLTSFDAGNGVSDSQFSPDGQFVVTAGEHGTARIFSTALAGPIRTVEANAEHRIKRRFTPSEERAYLGE